jgi:hypothetical protein
MYRFDLSEPQWQRIEPFFSDRYHHGRAGHPWNEHRPLVNGLLWRHEIKGFEQAMQRARRPRQAGRKRWPERAAADKGYSFPWVRA